MAGEPILEARIKFNDKRLNTLLSYYKAATTQIVSTLEDVSDFTRSRRIAVLKQIDGILQKLDEKTYTWFKEELAENYKNYSTETLQALKSEGFPITTNFTILDENAIKALADDVMGYYREAYSGVKRSAMKMLSGAAKEQITAILAEGRITGDTRTAIADKIAGALKEGLVALVDRGGRRWSLESYANMLTRTMLVKTANTGIVNRLAKDGYDLVQVSDHQGECELCRPWENKILSISGKHPGYKTLDEAESEGLFHPNCKHRYLPYHESLAEVSAVWNADKQRYINL